jgi:YfiH family protein
MNLGEFVGDDPVAVARNREQLGHLMGVPAVYLKQVHGIRVVRVTRQDAWPATPVVLEADACVTSEPGLACLVQTADCLPVLFAAPGGAAIGAAHAGWRGLAAGVLERTLSAVCELAQCAPADVWAWLGVCIGPDDFEVGADVLRAFDCAAEPGASAPRFVAQPDQRWRADLAGLATDRLKRAGVTQLGGGTWPTRDSRFFSYRRDAGVTGRMGAAIWIRG